MKRTRVVLLASLTALALILGCGSSEDPAAPETGLRLLALASDSPGQFDVFVFDLLSFSYRPVPGLNSLTANDLRPSISRDGSRLVFESDRPGAGGRDLYLYDLAGSQPGPALGINTSADETEPALTANGARIAFVRDTLGFKRIRLFDPVAGRYVPLPGLDTTAAFNDWAPAVDEDGSTIAFVSDRSGNADVLVYDASRVPPVIEHVWLGSASTDTEPALTPDGRYLCFASNRPGGRGDYDVYLFDLQAMGPIGLAVGANSVVDDRNPAINENASVLCFESSRPGSLGKVDVWNHSRSTGQTGQAAGQSSPLNELQPSLVWR
jgi:Tol biopolymer transport system component